MDNSRKTFLFSSFLKAARPQFLLASGAPVFVGSAAAFASSVHFYPLFFLLALSSIVLLQAAANIINDYYDHVYGADWANKNPTPFSGGSRAIQNQTLSPKATFLFGFACLAAGSILGIIIVFLTKSVFILSLGIIGVIGCFFYTAGPLKLAYRTWGEPVIALLFGLLPVYGAFYLQTGTLNAFCLIPAILVGIHVFLIIFINEFPDLASDAAVGKKTLVVRIGVGASIRIYKISLYSAYLIAVTAFCLKLLSLYPAILYVVTFPIALKALKLANKETLCTPGSWEINKLTILLHTLTSAGLTIGFIIQHFLSLPKP